MERIERVIAASRRRLVLSVFTSSSARALLVLSALFLAAALAARVFSLALPLDRIAAGLVLAAPLMGGVFALARRPTRLRAASEIDRRLSLGERVSSALLVGRRPERPVEQAVLASAEARLEGLDLRRAFPIGFPRDFARAAAILLVAGLVAVFLPELGLLRKSQGATDDPAKRAERQRAQEDAKKIDNVRHRIEAQAKGKDLPALEQALQEMQEVSKKLETDAQNRKQELAKLSSLEDKLKERARSLPSLERLGQQMEKMPTSERMRDLEHALASQAAQKAEQALKKLVEEGLRYPYGIAVDREGRVFLAEYGNQRVQVLDGKDGRSLALFGRPGGAPGEFSSPWGLALDAAGRVYVADRDNHRIQVLTGLLAPGPAPEKRPGA